MVHYHDRGQLKYSCSDVSNSRNETYQHNFDVFNLSLICYSLGSTYNWFVFYVVSNVHKREHWMRGSLRNNDNNDSWRARNVDPPLFSREPSIVNKVWKFITFNEYCKTKYIYVICLYPIVNILTFKIIDYR